MQDDIMVTKDPQNGYSACPLAMPELVITGTDEADVLEKMREAIVALHSQSCIVRIDVPSDNRSADDPWMQFAGMWNDDPDWKQFQSDINDFRREIDARRGNDIEH